MCVHHHLQGVPIGPEVGDQHLDGAAGLQAADLADGVGEDVRAAVGQLVAVHAGEHGVAQAHLPHRFRHPQRLLFVQRLGAPGLDVAEAAGAGAGVAHQQEGGRAAAPALAQVGAERLFAHGVQRLAPHQALELPVLIVLVYPDPQPLGPPPARQPAVAGLRLRFRIRTGRKRVDGNGRFHAGEYVEKGGGCQGKDITDVDSNGR